jgi:hypothetical protein
VERRKLAVVVNFYQKLFPLRFVGIPLIVFESIGDVANFSFKMVEVMCQKDSFCAMKIRKPVKVNLENLESA